MCRSWSCAVVPMLPFALWWSEVPSPTTMKMLRRQQRHHQLKNISSLVWFFPHRKFTTNAPSKSKWNLLTHFQLIHQQCGFWRRFTIPMLVKMVDKTLPMSTFGGECLYFLLGQFCNALLKKTAGWTPKTSLVDVVKAVCQHIDKPDIDYSISPSLSIISETMSFISVFFSFRLALGREYMENRSVFNGKALEYVQKYGLSRN